MVKIANRKFKAKRAVRKVARKSVPAKGLTLAVKKFVKSTIHKQIENKQTLIQWSQSLGGYTASNTLYAFPLTPYSGYMPLAQGVNSQSRIGNLVLV